MRGDNMKTELDLIKRLTNTERRLTNIERYIVSVSAEATHKWTKEIKGIAPSFSIPKGFVKYLNIQKGDIVEFSIRKLKV